MNFLKNNVNSLKKKTMQWLYPNQNPTELDKYAFMLLDKGEVDLFISFMEMNNVNINVVDFNKASLLIKAQGIPSYQNEHTKLCTKEELESRAIKGIDYLVKKGIDINFQNKNGITAVLSASHWGYPRIVESLLKHGADPNIGSDTQGLQTTPLLSAMFKKHEQVVKLLLLYGADVEKTEELSKTTYGWKLSEEDIEKLYSMSNIIKITQRRYLEQAKGKKTILNSISQRLFDDILSNV